MEENFNYNLYTNLFGLARTLLSCSLLLTLSFNSPYDLFPHMKGVPVNSLLKIESIYNSLNFFLLLGISKIKVMYYIAITLLFITSIGFLPSLFCVIHWWIQYSFINSSSCVDGGDQIASNISLMLIPIFIFDNRIWHWQNIRIENIKWQKIILSNVVRKLIRIQMCVIYFHAAVGKFNVTEWVNGTAIYYWLNSSFFRMSPNLERITMFIISNPIISGVITWGVIIIEIILSFAFLSDKKYRSKLFILAVIFHSFFIVYFGLVSFFLVMLSGLIFYLVNPNKIINFKTK
ncbi:MAG: sporulation-delaying protein SdpB family protein [Bacteroidota bacterium]